MSEDVKPRLKTTDETFGLMARTEIVNWIELEPTMRLMDEMANKLQSLDDLIGDLSLSPNPESNTIRMEITYDILEKYRKFKEGLK